MDEVISKEKRCSRGKKLAEQRNQCRLRKEAWTSQWIEIIPFLNTTREKDKSTLKRKVQASWEGVDVTSSSSSIRKKEEKAKDLSSFLPVFKQFCKETLTEDLHRFECLVTLHGQVDGGDCLLT